MRGKYSDHVTSLDQGEASIQITWPVLTNEKRVLQVLTNQKRVLPNGDEAGGVEVAAVEEVELGEGGEVTEEGGEGEGGTALTLCAPLHLMRVTVTVQTSWKIRRRLQ